MVRYLFCIHIYFFTYTLIVFLIEKIFKDLQGGIGC